MVQQILGIPSGDIPINLLNSSIKSCDQAVQSNSIFLVSPDFGR